MPSPPCLTADGRLQNLHMPHRAQLRKACPATQAHLQVPTQSFDLDHPRLHRLISHEFSHNQLKCVQKTKASVEEFEGFLDVRSIVSHLHVNRLQHSVKQHNLGACSSKRALILPNPIPSELLLACTKNRVASVLHISKRNCTQQHLNHDIFAVDFYDHITGDCKERNNVLHPVRQLNVSDLLCTDLTKVYC